MPKLLNMTLTALKQRIEKNPVYSIQRSYGFGMECTFTWSKPASIQAINQFEEAYGFVLPEDYKAFLTLHNGAELFQDIGSDSPHWHIFGLDEIEDALERYPTPAHVYIIAKYDQTLIGVDNTRVKMGAKSYLLDQSTYTSARDDPEPMSLNFELWLDRLIAAQGDHYWFWNHIDPNNMFDGFPE
ncbi:SMI1/KNR4 family protein [Paenibacillus spiritus]|uniref:SMI1/KNR4 family protein n=1 Tax=Paenibacillus spiritus TaxID=2496557 RepID=A0A5J5GEE6_9BACL|nr:SMI1/KNR4 family protein [Paenibacillus spiritus]KAA9005834.1 SMI1/KNR4 family protein [Paenibacillus spiritus]